MSNGSLLTESYAGPSIDSLNLDRTWGDAFGEYGSNVLATGKGYFWDAPAGIVTGAYDLALNFGDVMEARSPNAWHLLWSPYMHGNYCGASYCGASYCGAHLFSLRS
jgi:hypothetical protein